MTVRQISAPLVAALVLFFISTAAIAQKVHYRWMDDRGNPVHSDRPPPKGIDYEVVETGSSLVRVVDSDEGAVPAETTPRVGNEFEPVETRPNEEGSNPEYCLRARENLAALESGAEINVRNNQGELVTLSADQVADEIVKAREAISSHCR